MFVFSLPDSREEDGQQTDAEILYTLNCGEARMFVFPDVGLAEAWFSVKQDECRHDGKISGGERSSEANPANFTSSRRKECRMKRFGVGVLISSLIAMLVLAPVAQARSAAEVNAAVDRALAQFTVQIKGAKQLLTTAKGVLVFPDVIKAGAGIGAEFGEGALRVGGRTTAYYSFASASIGLQLGIQKKDIIIVFLQDAALSKFRAKGPNEGWQVGVDGSVVLVNVGAGASIDSEKLNQPIVGFVVGQKGLMYNLTLEGSKITKINK
jgi:lipid-binding SYLF domain-containing protein